MLDSNYYMNEIEKEKIRKFQLECDQNGVKFIPAAFTTKSNWSRGVEKLIDEHIEFLSDVKGYDKAIMTNWAKSKLAFKIAKATCSVIIDKILKTQGSKYNPLDFNQAITQCDNQEEYNSELRAHANLLRGRPALSINDRTELM